jgi:hypothetical protein
MEGMDGWNKNFRIRDSSQYVYEEYLNSARGRCDHMGVTLHNIHEIIHSNVTILFCLLTCSRLTFHQQCVIVHSQCLGCP